MEHKRFYTTGRLPRKKQESVKQNKPKYIFQEFYNLMKNSYKDKSIEELKKEIVKVEKNTLNNDISRNYTMMMKEILNGLIRDKKSTIAGGTIGNRWQAAHASCPFLRMSM